MICKLQCAAAVKSVFTLKRRVGLLCSATERSFSFLHAGGRVRILLSDDWIFLKTLHGESWKKKPQGVVGGRKWYKWSAEKGKLLLRDMGIYLYSSRHRTSSRPSLIGTSIDYISSLLRFIDDLTSPMVGDNGL